MNLARRPAKHESAEAIEAARAVSQDHVTRIAEIMAVQHEQILHEMLHQRRPEQAIRATVFDSSVTGNSSVLPMRSLIMPHDLPIGNIFVENLCTIANVFVYLGQQRFDAAAGIGPPPYMTIGPGKWKSWPVDMNEHTSIAVFMCDTAAGTGLVRAIIDTKPGQPNQGSV